MLTVKIGGAESNSFVTVAEADAVIPLLPDDPTQWEDLEEADKEYRLRLACNLMSTLNLKGRRVYCSQALAFPRTPQNNYRIIPSEVKETQVFLAYSVIHRGLAGRSAAVTDEDPGARVSHINLGGMLSVSFAGSGSTKGMQLDKVIRSGQFPTYLTMTNWFAQVRGGSVPNLNEVECLTTTTT